MRILIGGSTSKIFHFGEFEKALTDLGVECKLVVDSDVYDGFPTSEISKWFQTSRKFKQLVSEFKPDVIITDRQRHFAMAAARSKIPLVIHLRGDIWAEFEYARQTRYTSMIRRFALYRSKVMFEESFKKSSLIVPICKYLEKIVNDHYPDKKTNVMYSSVDTTRWYQEKGMTLKHPCVGLLQSASIWGKAKEMLVLENVLKSMPDVMFYWAGDGMYLDDVLPRLKKYPNFEWLGSLQYPDKVRQYLTEIDVYALVSGLDMSPLTLLEAQLMKKPVVATRVAGIPEFLIDGVTGFLVEEGNPDDYIEKFSLLIGDEVKGKTMGESGRKFVEENFNLNKIVSEFLETLKKHLKL